MKYIKTCLLFLLFFLCIGRTAHAEETAYTFTVDANTAVYLYDIVDYDKETAVYDVNEPQATITRDGVFLSSTKGVYHATIQSKTNTLFLTLIVNAQANTTEAVHLQEMNALLNLLQPDFPLKTETFESYYATYIDIFTRLKKYSEYEKYFKKISTDADHYIALPGSWRLDACLANMKNFMSNRNLQISSAKHDRNDYITLKFNHRIDTLDICYYGVLTGTNTLNNISFPVTVTVYNAKGQPVYKKPASVTVDDTKLSLLIDSSFSKNATYSVTLTYGKEEDIFVTPMKSFTVDKNLYSAKKKTIYLKKNTSIYESDSTDSPVAEKANVYKAYKQIKTGTNGWVMIKLPDGKIVYVKSGRIAKKKKKVPKKKIVSTSDTLYDYKDMVKDIEELALYFPNYVTSQVLGQTADGRDFYCLTFGNPYAKKQILIQASMHAREWKNTQIIMAQLEYYCRKYKSGSYKKTSYKKLFDNICIYIMPMTNPDGVTISQHGANALNNAALRRLVKNTHQSTRTWKSNGRGVNLNYNFDTGWKKLSCGAGPDSERSKGTKAVSELESRIMVDFVNSHSLCAVVSLHEMGNVIYWNYGQKGSLAKKSTALVNTIRGITGYMKLGEYCNSGGFSDWCSHKKKIPSCTVETGTIAAPVSHSQFKTMYRQTQKLLPALAKLYH